ncbi:AmiS/UreI family transporter [Thalassobacillus devorans]|uniref:AmiS/UreI family transporter n=1 Tax=Thalassobacillus devorans TaxID=279813 RepID=UPI000A1C908E|nr:AmiS/UreI family transporter [Thalassobacillus devorans]
MSNVGLLYVGAVLFVNGLMLLNRVDGKSAAVFNLFVGTLQVITPLYLIITANGDTTVILNASGIFLFGFTYLYVGLTNLFDLNTTGLGYYCLWVAVIAGGFSLLNFFQFGDMKFGIIWGMWTYLWLLFFLLLGLEMDIGSYVGKVTFVQSWITATIPAFLSLMGVWNALYNLFFYIIAVAAVVYFISISFSTSRNDSVNKVA